jgi:chaperonin cofactor prefoldin
MPTSLEDLDRRVTALERAQGENTETLKWVVAKLGRVSAVQDEHTLRLDRIEGKLETVNVNVDNLTVRIGQLEAKIDAIPRVVAELLADPGKRR